MTFQLVSLGTGSACGPVFDSPEATNCSSCAPKLAFSFEEEAILSMMRSLKKEVRDIAAKIRDIDQFVRSDPGLPSVALRNERYELTEQLNELRFFWRRWSHRLDEANEKKLISLGHREPHQVFN